MALWLIGLGLGDERDVTLKGADAIRGADVVFLESYTSVLGVPKERLEEVYGKPIAIAYRETVESEAERIIGPAKEGKKVAFLVVGDPFCATTHTDLLIRAQDAGVPTHVVHNACIMSAAGACGLQLYNFGATVSIPFFRAEWRPDSFYDKVKYNAGGGMHTLALLDIKVREPNYDALVATGKLAYHPPRFMTVNEAAEQLMEVEARRKEGVCGPDTLAIGLARVGQDSQRIIAGTLAELAVLDFGPPLHSLVLVGSSLHDLERAMFEHFRPEPGQYPPWVRPTAPEDGSGSDNDSDAGR